MSPKSHPQLIAITNRTLCPEDLPTRITRLCEAGFDHVIVREKDLDRDEYGLLLEAMSRTVPAHFWPRIILHTYTPSELRAHHPELETFLDQIGGFHLTAAQAATGMARHLTAYDRAYPLIGTSTHNRAEAICAREGAMTYVIASHLYPTACKPGLAPHGLALLDEVAHLIDPATTKLWALGGITPERTPEVTAAGAEGLCVMSSAMTEDPLCLVRAFQEALK